MHDGLIHHCWHHGDERKVAAEFRQLRVVLKKSQESTEMGGGGRLGVEQVALGVSTEGSRGSRICGGRAVRRGHGEIS